MEKKLKIVFLDRITAGPIKLKERFSKYGEYIEYDDTNPEKIVERISDADVIITNRIKLRKEHFEKAPKLKLILITATGFNHIDIEGGNEKGIKTANVSDYSTNSVAQLAITYLLNELTPITEYSKEVKNNKWLDITIPEFQSYPVNDAEGKILGIVGFGTIGKKVAAIAEIVDEVMNDPSSASSIADIKAGKEKAIGYLVGQVMKRSRGKANPALARIAGAKGGRISRRTKKTVQKTAE